MVLLQLDYMIAGMPSYQHAGLGEREVRTVRTVGERSLLVDLPTGFESVTRSALQRTLCQRRAVRACWL